MPFRWKSLSEHACRDIDWRRCRSCLSIVSMENQNWGKQKLFYIFVDSSDSYSLYESNSRDRCNYSGNGQHWERGWWIFTRLVPEAYQSFGSQSQSIERDLTGLSKSTVFFCIHPWGIIQKSSGWIHFFPTKRRAFGHLSNLGGLLKGVALIRNPRIQWEWTGYLQHRLQTSAECVYPLDIHTILQRVTYKATLYWLVHVSPWVCQCRGCQVGHQPTSLLTTSIAWTPLDIINVWIQRPVSCLNNTKVTNRIADWNMKSKEGHSSGRELFPSSGICLWCLSLGHFRWLLNAHNQACHFLWFASLNKCACY